jgi:biotin operon repressor
MPEKKNTKTIAPIDIDALVEKRLSVSKDELRQEILEEQLAELLQSDAIQEATLHDAIEQLKHAGKEIWKLVSVTPISEIARTISGTDRLKRKLLKGYKPKRKKMPLAECEENKKKLLGLLQASTQALSLPELAKALSMDIYAIKKAILELRQANLIITQGKMRGTRYSAA